MDFMGTAFTKTRSRGLWSWHAQHPGGNAPLATRSSWAQNDVTKGRSWQWNFAQALPCMDPCRLLIRQKHWKEIENSSPILAWLGSNILYQVREPTSAHAAGDWDYALAAWMPQSKRDSERNVKLIHEAYVLNITYIYIIYIYITGWCAVFQNAGSLAMPGSPIEPRHQGNQATLPLWLWERITGDPRGPDILAIKIMFRLSLVYADPCCTLYILKSGNEQTCE